jgi:hypothetical protein
MEDEIVPRRVGLAIGSLYVMAVVPGLVALARLMAMRPPHLKGQYHPIFAGQTRADRAL